MLDRSKFIGRGADPEEGAPKPAYRHQAFPAMMHHQETQLKEGHEKPSPGATKIVQDQAEADALGEGWHPLPAGASAPDAAAPPPAKKTAKK